MRVFAKAVLLCTVLFSTSSAFGQTPNEAGTAQNTEAKGEPAAAVAQTSDNTENRLNQHASNDSARQASDDGARQASDDGARAKIRQDSENIAAQAAADPDTAPGDASVVTAARLEKQIREVGTSVDTLKEDTFTTKSRLLLLREEVLQRSVSGSRLQVRHKNEMGGQYTLVQIYYAIDRQPIFMRDNSSGDLNAIDDEVISDQLLSPGSHQLTVLYIYKGKPWGVFTYMNDYTFRVESGYDFSVEEGKSAELVVTAAEAGDFFTAYEKRPTVRYSYEQYDLISATADEKSEGDAQ